MLEDTINYRLMNQYCQNVVHTDDSEMFDNRIYTEPKL